MGTYTSNLNLYNTNMTTDGNDTFDFQRDLNDNNDKIDSAFGNLANLTTIQKANLVSAINEIVSNLDGKTSKSLNDLNAVGQAILDKKVEVEALLQQNGYAKFTWKENNVISNLTICWGHIETSIVAGLSSKSLTMPISMYVYGESVSTGTRTVNIQVTAYNYNTQSISTQYKFGFQNVTNSTQTVNAYYVVFGK